jgi:single-strand DNA-binding protein
MNIVVLRGTLSSDPVQRELASGTSLVQYEVTTRCGDGPAASVPVAWFDPPDSSVALGAGTEVVVAGQVRRRFFRTGGATASRTEVVAQVVLPATQKRKVERLLSAMATEVA